MAALGSTVTFHTVHGNRAAIVIGHDKEGDNDHELAVFQNAADVGEGGQDTGLTGQVNYRRSHENDQAGGFTA